jgi:ubiquinone/menaquinone biosynthesis C-methylase UbiE
VSTQEHYIPAAGQHWLLPAYDPLQRWLLREAELKGRLVQEAQIQPGSVVLDVGCGTGTLAVLLKQREPQARVVGLDPDPAALQRARRKVGAATVAVDLMRGSASALPYADGGFDRVVSSLAFHHLDRTARQQALAEIWRILRPGGLVCLLDFGPPHTAYGQAVALVLRRFEEVADNLAGRLPTMLAEAGFLRVAELARYTTAFGPVSLYRGYKDIGARRA